MALDPKDASQIVVDPDWHKVAWISGVAFIGAFFRYQRWINKEGKFVWYRILFDIPGSVAFGVMAIGFSYLMWGEKVSVWIIGGVSGFLGMVGPAFIQAIATRFLGAKE